MNRSPLGASVAAGARGHLPRAWQGRVVKTTALGVLSCAVATAGLVVPAGGAVTDPHTVAVLKNDSIVEVEGLASEENVLVQVKRNNVVVGSVEGPASVGGSFIINHDFCWDRLTPVILPGDVVQVTTASGVDTVPVTDIEVTEGPVVVGNSFTIRGQVNQTPRPPVDELQVEARTNTPIRFRPLAPDVSDGVTGTVSYDAATGGAFTATFTGLDAEQTEAANNLGEFHVAHVAAVGAAGDPREVTMATEGSPVPGPGCSIDAPTVSEAVTAVTPTVIGRRNPGATLRVQGFAQNAGTVTVNLRDQDGTVVSGPATLVGTTAQTWTASFDATATAALNGRITVSASVDGARAAVTQTVLKDLVAPNAPTASVRAGTYRRAQAVSLNPGVGNRVRYTLGNGRQAAPTATRGTLYRGGQVRIASSQTLKMVAVDRAGNVSRLVRVRYVIARRPARPQVGRALAGARGGRTTAIATWRAPVGSQVTGYRVTALRLRANGSVSSRQQSKVLRPRARRLQMRLPGGRYRFQVRAVNGFGSSPLSARSNAVRSR